MIVIELIVTGVLLGGLYALFGLGLSLIFGVMRIANVAHGDLAVLGAFLVILMPLPLLVAVPAAVLMGALLGWALQTVFLSRLMGSDPMPPLMVTFGLAIVIQNLLVATFGANNRSIPAGDLATASIPFGGLSLGVLPLLIFALSLLLFAGLHILLNRTALGRAIRATASSPDLVGLFGIRRRQVFALVMAISVALAFLAGILLATRSSITPFSGAERLLVAFEVVVIGGLGSIWSTYLGGLVLGLIHAVGFYFDPASGQLYGHLALLLLLLVRPQGLAGRTTGR